MLCKSRAGGGFDGLSILGDNSTKQTVANLLRPLSVLDIQFAKECQSVFKRQFTG